MDDSVLRENLVGLLTGEHAHVGAKRAFEGLRPEYRMARPRQGAHSIWELLEHVRIAQEDIVRYTLDPAWRSPEFPSGYWPAPAETVSPQRWSVSLAAFLGGLEETVALVRDPARDLTARIPHGEGRTYLRQVLLIADHNAYHVGQVVDLRKTLGDWKG
jgi:hypothetical protein